MPVYLVFLQVAKKNLQFATGDRHQTNSFELCFILSKYLLKLNCLKIFIYAQDYRLMKKIQVQTENTC